MAYLIPLATPQTELGPTTGANAANEWYVTGAGFQVNRLGFYRTRTGTNGAATRLYLWDAVAQTIINSWTPADTGTVGWQWTTLPTPYVLSDGHHYLISVTFDNGHFFGITTGTTPTPDAPFTFVVNRSGANGNPPVWPATTGAGQGSLNVDVGLQNIPPYPAPTDAGVNNTLAAWLSTDTESQQHTADGLPYLTKVAVDDVSAQAGDIQDQQNDWAFGLAGAAHGYYADIKTLIGNIKTVTDTLPTPIAQLTSIVLDHYTADIDNILAQIDSVLSGLGAQSTDLSGTAGSAVGALSGRTGFPATGWSMSAEADFEDAIAFAAPADAYVLAITSYQETQPATESPAGLWLPRLGWWCVLNGTLASQRQFVDFQEMVLDDGGRRMPGCAIQLRPGTLATVQAWLLA